MRRTIGSRKTVRHHGESPQSESSCKLLQFRNALEANNETPTERTEQDVPERMHL